MKKILAFLLCAAMAVSFVGCGGSKDSENTGTTNNAGDTGTTTTDTPSAGATTGKIEVEIVSVAIVKDIKDADAALVTYKFTNNTSKKQNFKFATSCAVKQGEATLDAAIISEANGYDQSLPSKNLENGESTEVKLGYALTDTTTPIDVIVKRRAGEDKTDITAQLALS